MTIRPDTTRTEAAAVLAAVRAGDAIAILILRDALGWPAKETAALLDDLRLHLVPVLLGDGVRLFDHHGPGRSKPR